MTAVTQTKKRRRRTEPETPHETLNLLPSQREIIGLLVEYRFLTPRLLAVAYGAKEGRGGQGLKYIQNQLGKLYHHGYVKRFYRSQKPTGYGSDQYVYTASHKAAKAILTREDYSIIRRSLYLRENEQRTTYEHHLEVAALQIILTLEGRRIKQKADKTGQAPAWEIESFRSDEERDPDDKLQAKVGGRTIGLWPDASVLIRFPDEKKDLGDQHTLYQFEIDLTRKNNERQRDRFRAYATHIKEQIEKLARLREKSKPRPYNNVVAVFVAASESEVERQIEMAAEVLQEWSRGKRPLFLFWNLEDWYEYEELSDSANKRQWQVRVLREPRRILQEDTVSTIRGDARRLVQA